MGNQCHTYGLSSWIPFYGQGVYDNPQLEYYVRSHLCPSFSICVDVRKGNTNWDRYRRLVEQWRQVADCFLGDFFPLTPYSLSDDCWIAWQFDRPESGDGVVQAFRRTKILVNRSVKLRILEPDAVYEVTNFDAASPKQMGGKELLEQGLLIDIGEKPGAARQVP